MIFHYDFEKKRGENMVCFGTDVRLKPVLLFIILIYCLFNQAVVTSAC
jgi:hypothetical protein